MEILSKNPELAKLAELILSGLATEADFVEVNPAEVFAIKSDTGVKHYKAIADDVLKVSGDRPRSRRFVASEESVDRMGDIIRVDGWDFRNFKKNPVALWAHQDRQLPIGTVSDIEKGMKGGRKVLFETIDYVAEELNPFAEAVFGLVDAGVIKAVSVGFLPTKVSNPQDQEERDEIGLGSWGVDYQKQEQLELSNCTVPAHPAALASKQIRRALNELVGEGRIREEAADAMLEQLDRQRRKRTAWWSFKFDPAEPHTVSMSIPFIEEDGELAVPAGARRKVEAAPAPDPDPAKGETATLEAHTGDPLATEKAVTALHTRIEEIGRGLSDQLDRVLAAVAELRQAQEEQGDEQEALADQVASLKGVLRSSARGVDASTFFQQVLDEVRERTKELTAAKEAS